MCKSNINQISVNCLSISSEVNNTLRSFWKMDSKIIKVSDEGGLSQDDKNCLAGLDSVTVYTERNMKFLCYGKEKKDHFQTTTMQHSRGSIC